MTGELLEKFRRKVLSKGGYALLPQKLSDKWLDILREEAKVILEGDNPDEIMITGLLSAVMVIEITRSGYSSEVQLPLNEVQNYAFNIAMEHGRRQGIVEFDDPPTLEDVLEKSVSARMV